MNAPCVTVRAATPADVPALLSMMRELAAFEGYLADFAVTETELLQRGFPTEGAPEFLALLAENATGTPAGYAVCYTIPFTYDLRPTLVIKELFVRSRQRSQGIGQQLLAAIERTARDRGCGLIKWAVLPGNARAEKFYRTWGGAPDTRWNYWHRAVPTISP